jgi:hypothetical protein
MAPGQSEREQPAPPAPGSGGRRGDRPGDGGAAAVRIEVYHDDDPVAVFEYGRYPSYYGARGRQVRALVRRPHAVRNLWTGEAAPAPPDGSPRWWASAIFSAGLREAGFAVRVHLCLAGVIRDFGVAGTTD